MRCSLRLAIKGRQARCTCGRRAGQASEQHRAGSELRWADTERAHRKCPGLGKGRKTWAQYRCRIALVASALGRIYTRNTFPHGTKTGYRRKLYIEQKRVHASITERVRKATKIYLQKSSIPPWTRNAFAGDFLHRENRTRNHKQVGLSAHETERSNAARRLSGKCAMPSPLTQLGCWVREKCTKARSRNHRGAKADECALNKQCITTIDMAILWR